jgi:hypothetical protein
MDHQNEGQYITSNYNEEENYELHLKQRKFAKFYIFFGFLGVFAGLSASISFFFVYKLLQAPIYAIISGMLNFVGVFFNFFIILTFYILKQLLLHLSASFIFNF